MAALHTRTPAHADRVLGKSWPRAGSTRTQHVRPLNAAANRISLQDANLGPFPRLQEMMISGPKWTSSSKQTTTSNQQQQQPSSAVELAAVAAAAAAQQSKIEEELFLELPQWAQRFMRQVPELPTGRRTLLQLLSSFEDVKAKAVDACGEQKAAVEAYLHLALIDVVSQAWQQHMEELEQSLDVTAAQGRASRTSQLAQQHLDGRLALCGCRYLRLEASANLAKQVHLLLDCQGFEPSINLSALPQPHTLGLNFAQLLQQGLGLDLANPKVRAVPEDQLQCLQAVPFEEYHAVVTSDAALSGECWAFDYWGNCASLAPAPFTKFGTGELAALLTHEAMLDSLENGVWGRALVAAATEAGLVLQVPAKDSQQEVAVMAGAGSVGSASAWLFLQSQLAETVQQGGLQRMRQLALAVMAAAVTVLQVGQQQQQ